MPEQKSITKTQIFIGLLVLVLLIAIIVLAMLSRNKNDQPILETTVTTESTAIQDEAADDAALVVDSPNFIVFNEQVYGLNPDIVTFLFLGVDNNSEENATPFMILFLFDLGKEDIKIVKVPTNLTALGEVYDSAGNLIAVEDMPVGRQFSYAVDNEMGNEISNRIIRRLIDGNRINYMCSMSFDGMLSIVDYLGTLDVVMRNDWTDVNPDYELDETITMTPDDIEEMFTTIINSENFDNSGRLNRNDWFMLALFFSVIHEGGDDVQTLLDIAGNEYVGDIGTDIFDNIGSYVLRSSEVLPDRNEVGEEAYTEYLISLFYEEYELE